MRLGYAPHQGRRRNSFVLSTRGIQRLARGSNAGPERPRSSLRRSLPIFARVSTPVANGKAAEQMERFFCRKNGTRSPLSKASRVVEMGVREYDCCWRNDAEPAEPIRPTIDHDTGSVVPNKEGAVPPVPARADLDFAARAEKRQLHGLQWSPFRSQSAYRPISGSASRSFFSSGISVMVASVNNSVLATDTAFSSPMRTTFVGSMMPASIKST